MRVRSIHFLLAVLILSGSKAFAGEAECLRDIMNAEARGQTFTGVVGIGQAAMAKARVERSTLCKLGGVHRKSPAREMAEYYLTLARHLIAHPSESVSQGADHWNTGKRPAYNGKVTRQLDDHVLYVLAPVKEK